MSPRCSVTCTWHVEKKLPAFQILPFFKRNFLFKKKTAAAAWVRWGAQTCEKHCGVLYLTKSIPSGQEIKSDLSQRSHLEVLGEHQMFSSVFLLAASRSELVKTSASAASEDSLSLYQGLEAFELEIKTEEKLKTRSWRVEQSIGLQLCHPVRCFSQLKPFHPNCHLSHSWTCVIPAPTSLHCYNRWRKSVADTARSLFQVCLVFHLKESWIGGTLVSDTKPDSFRSETGGLWGQKQHLLLDANPPPVSLNHILQGVVWKYAGYYVFIISLQREPQEGKCYKSARQRKTLFCNSQGNHLKQTHHRAPKADTLRCTETIRKNNTSYLSLSDKTLAGFGSTLALMAGIRPAHHRAVTGRWQQDTADPTEDGRGEGTIIRDLSHYLGGHF